MSKSKYLEINDELFVSENLQEIINLIIVTATNVEIEAALESIIPLPNQDNISIYYKGNLTYYIGVLGNYPVALFKCTMMGSLKRDASLTAVLEAIELWKPKSTIMIGIAFGRDESKQKIGDILISETLSQYETVKEKEPTITIGHSVPCSPILLNRFTQDSKWHSAEDGTRYDIIKCELLSGEKLINNDTVKKQLFNRFPDAQGGEMEGNGVYSACDRKKIDWIIIKSICDWADGKKSDQWQRLAAKNSINYVKSILSSDNILKEAGIPSINSSEISELYLNQETDYKDIKGYITVKIIYPKQEVNEIIKEKDPKKKIYYEYIEVKLTDTIILGYLFLRNPETITQINTITHFYSNYSKRYTSLFVCSPKVKKRKSEKEGYVDRLKSLKSKFHQVADDNEINKIKFVYTEDLIWEQCLGSEITKLNYNLEEEKYFIDQKIEVLRANGNIDNVFSLDYFKEVLNKEHINKPIITVFGGAGVGKTTLCDQLVNLIDSFDKKKSIYISSSDIASNISDIEVNSISDLYRLSSSEYIEDKAKLLDPANLEINISCGNIVVVIDGLDEIESKLKERFSFNNFINNSISLNESYQNCTIIITSRDYYKNQYEHNPSIELLSMYGFNHQLATDYISKRLHKGLRHEALKLLKELHISYDDYYPPVTLSLVCDIIESESEIDNKNINKLLSSSKYLNAPHTLDTLIIKLIEREIKRQSLNMSVDDVVDVLIEIVVLYKGEIPKHELNNILELYDPALNIEGYTGFYVNPLLKTKHFDDYVKIRYDSISILIKNRYFIYCIENKKIDISYLKNILIEFYDGHSQLLNEIVNNIISITIAVNSVRIIISILQKQYDDALLERNHKQVEISKKLISASLYFFFTKFSTLNKTERSEYLLQIYSGRIVHMFIFESFYPLDFRELTIEESAFDKYENFEKSSFPVNRTVFYSTSFKGIRPKSKINAEIALFDNSCSLNKGLKIAVSKGEESKSKIIEAVKSDFTILFTVLFRNRTFVKKSENIFKNERGNLTSKISLSEYIKFFLSNDVFLKENSYSSSSKYIFSITDAYKSDIKYLLTNNTFTSKLENLFCTIIQSFYDIKF